MMNLLKEVTWAEDIKTELYTKPLSRFDANFLSAQGLSADPIFLVDDISEIAANKQTEAKKLITKNLEKKFVVDKVWSAQNETEALNLLRLVFLVLCFIPLT